MTDIIKVNYDNADRPTVSGRELHQALGIETRYNDWFPRMCEYGFTEGKDFYSILSKTPEGGRPSTEHIDPADFVGGELRLRGDIS